LVGLDRERLLIRVDAVRPMRELLRQGREVSVQFIEPPALRCTVRWTDRVEAGLQMCPGPGEAWITRPGSSVAAAQSILELAVPFDDLGVVAGQRMRFVVVVSDGPAKEIERSPEGQPIELRAPGMEFDGRNWRT
jgi:hypothetical protein